MINIDWKEFMRDHCVFGFYANSVFTKGTVDKPYHHRLGHGILSYGFYWTWNGFGPNVPWHRCFVRLSGRKPMEYAHDR